MVRKLYRLNYEITLYELNKEPLYIADFSDLDKAMNTVRSLVDPKRIVEVEIQSITYDENLDVVRGNFESIEVYCTKENYKYANKVGSSFLRKNIYII